MDSESRQTIGLVTASMLCLLTVTHAQQARDGKRPAAIGTATVSGVVLLDDELPRPLRRARVMLNGGELAIGRTVITNDDGSFEIGRLPAGRYTLGVVKDGYVPMNYGARRPNRPGTAIGLREGEARTVTLRMPRGGVITGTIVEADGQPASGLAVNAMNFRFVPSAAARRMGPAASSTTDDRGVYRIYGLAAGEYFVVAHARREASQIGDLQIISSAEVQRALAEVKHGGARTEPGSPAASAPAAPAVAEPRRSVTLVPVFYPGTVDAGNARTVTVGHGEERSGVDFQIQYVSTATVSGIVAIGSATGSSGVSISRTDDHPAFATTRLTRTDAEGRFSFSGIERGKYTVFARMGSGMWGQREIIVDGEDVAGVGVALEPGLTIAGRIVFEGNRPPPDLTTVRLPLPAIVRTGPQPISLPLPNIQMQPGGRFALSGVIPGLYRLAATMQGLRAPVGAWWLKSVTMGGREMLDAPLDLQRNASDVVVTFTDRTTELSGVVRDAEGNPLSDRIVVVFGADKTTWFANSRRVAGERPNLDGRYTIRNLPPGDYLMVVSEDLEQNEWLDPAVLETLAPGATRIVLRENEQKKQDWMVASIHAR